MSINIDEQINTLEETKNKLNQYFKDLGIIDYKDKVKELENQMTSPSFWNDQENANKITKEVSNLKKTYNEWDNLIKSVDNLIEIGYMIKEGYEEFYEDFLKEYKKIIEEFTKKETLIYFNGKFDKSSAYLSINAGAGGTESNDWVSMLTRMYLRWAERMGYETEIIDKIDGEEAGIKSITIYFNGEYAYGYLSSEIGVHRLVRISPFDANARRHTSFASVSVLPEIKEDIEININPNDLKIDTYRASGAGGQYVNKTESAIRITHIPTGIVVQCQQERSQHKNREKAMMFLKAKLYDYYEKKKNDELKSIEGEKKEIGWGNQIRSYVFQPYRLVKDHRTNYETGNVDKVMDGYIDDFMTEFLKWKIKK